MADTGEPVGRRFESYRPSHKHPLMTIRRRHAVAAFGAAAGAAVLAPRHARGAGAPVRLAWPRGAVADLAVTIANDLGLFAQYGLAVTLVEAAPSGLDLAGRLASGEEDAAVGPVLLLLEPLRQGLDAKLTTGLGGGGLRLLAEKRSGLRHIEDIKHKRIGVADARGQARLFFSIMMRRKGVDPLKDVEWLVIEPAEQEGAIRAGRVDAVAAADPQAFYLLRALQAVEIATNLSGSYRQRVANVLACGGRMLRDRRDQAVSLTRALRQAAWWPRGHAHEAAMMIAGWATRLDEADRTAMVRSETIGETTSGRALVDDLAEYADELRLLGLFPYALNAEVFARGVCDDVLGKS